MITLKEKSWHHWIANNFGNFDLKTNSDICSYTRSVVFGLFRFIVVFVLVTFLVTIIVGFPIVSVVWGLGRLLGISHALVHGSQFEAIVTVGFTFIFIGCIVGICALISVLRQNYKMRHPNGSQPGFITEVYRSWKGKYCAEIKFK